MKSKPKRELSPAQLEQRRAAAQRAGRPKTGRWLVQVSVAEPDLQAAIETLCDERGISRPAAIRLAARRGFGLAG